MRVDHGQWCATLLLATEILGMPSGADERGANIGQHPGLDCLANSQTDDAIGMVRSVVSGQNSHGVCVRRAHEGVRKAVTPVVEECARWAVPKASFTNMSALAASCEPHSAAFTMQF